MSARRPRGSQGPSQDCLSRSLFPRSPHRVLCETVKDFVARVGKAYEKTTESSEESEVMAKKVRPGCLGWVSGRSRSPSTPSSVPRPVLCPEREAGFSPQDPG